MPYSNRKLQLSTLNQDCISGFYIYQKELNQFIDCKFYIPSKKDWIILTHENVKWSNLDDFKKVSKDYLGREFSPLCWIKKPNGEMNKFFLVWWL